MGRVGIVVELAPVSPIGFVPPDQEVWDAMEAGLWQAVHDELTRRLPDEPEAEVLDVIDAACMMEPGCEPGLLSAWCRDDLAVTAHAAEHWYRVGLALVAVDVRARVAALRYRVVDDLGDPRALASEAAGQVLRHWEGDLVLVDLVNEEVVVDEGQDEPDEDAVAELLADASADPRCGCALCEALRG